MVFTFTVPAREQSHSISQVAFAGKQPPFWSQKSESVQNMVKRDIGVS